MHDQRIRASRSSKAFPGPFAQACEHRVGLVDLVADGAEIGADRAEIGAAGDAPHLLGKVL